MESQSRSNVKLNLGCGDDIKEGWFNVDNEKHTEGINLVYDINNIPLPFEDNSIDEIKLYSVLEHLNNPYAFMLELHRISKKGARLYLKYPHFSATLLWRNIQHKRGFSWTTFDHKLMTKRFKTTSRKIKTGKTLKFLEWAINLFPNIYELFFSYIIKCEDMYIELEVIK